MDEQAYIEREACEDGQQEYIERCRANDICPYCGGDGEVVTAWRYYGLEPIYGECEDCGGSGRTDDDSEQENAQ